MKILLKVEEDGVPANRCVAGASSPPVEELHSDRQGLNTVDCHQEEQVKSVSPR